MLQHISHTAGVPAPLRVYLDSQPALDLVDNPVYHARAKQMLEKYHFVRDRVHKEKEVVLLKISANQMCQTIFDRVPL